MPSTVQPPVQAVAAGASGAPFHPQAERWAEVWSYPAMLQQNAATNFIRAMETLANASSEIDRYRALVDAANSAFIFGKTDDARSYAAELLSLDEKFKAESWRNGSALHDGNLILGRLAVQEGRIEDAKEFLLNAGKTRGSPVLQSFGPNMSLARDLLHQGEQAIVLQYFELCRKFWAMGNERLTLWAEDVNAGNIPDFGANLFY